MNLQETLATVAERIRSDALKNEADVKHFVLLPVLRALDWDDSDPLMIRPEYAAGPGQVDYALLHDGRPLVFIEAKRLGNMDDKGEEQLFQYASNKGIPLLILTDGDRWDFYLSMAAGDPPERRFFRMELSLLEHKVPDFVGFLEEHLRQAAVVSGRAKSSAERLHASDVERKKAQKRIPQAWRDLGNERTETGSAIATLSEVIKKFARDDPSFMARFSEATVGRTRRVAARTPTALYEKAEFVEKYSEDLGNGWWLGTNRSADTIRRNVEVACRLAEVRFDSELKLIEAEHGWRRT